MATWRTQLKGLRIFSLKKLLCFKSWNICIWLKVIGATLGRYGNIFEKNHTRCHLIIFERLVGLRDLTTERENFQTILLYFFRWGISLFRVFSPHTSVFYRPTVIKKRGKDFPRDIFSYWCLITRRNSVRPRKVWFRNFIIYATFGFFFLFSFFFFLLSILPKLRYGQWRKIFSREVNLGIFFLFNP